MKNVLPVILIIFIAVIAIFLVFSLYLGIENYTGKRKITIEQDIYSKFLKYNLFQHYKTYLTLLIQ